jgi:hypothetical protein
MSAEAAQTSAPRGDTDAQFRYGAVFLIVLALLLFEILTPDTDWGRAGGIALAGAALVVAVGTSRERGQVRRRRAVLVGLGAAAVVILVGTGVLPATVAFLVGTALLAVLPIALGGGLLRLIRRHGVTPQAVAGALTIYLVVGLLFGSMIGFVSHVESGSYFAETRHVPNGIRVYYSFTVLTTTGFGDYTAAQSSGRALAVLEMLIGQLYLVTVIGLVVGNYAGRRIGRGGGDQLAERDLEAT